MYIVIAALVMAMGWSIRGRYGHGTGAMMPGAMLAMFLAVTSCRPDWQRRAAIAGLAGALGWAFGGQTSYGLLVGYTASGEFGTILYGYWTFVLAGGMWGAIGGGILGLALTEKRSDLSQYILPLTLIGAIWIVANVSGAREGLPDLYDTSWFETTSALAVALVVGLVAPSARRACRLIALLCIGWWLGLGILTLALGLRLNPPRSDSWAGCLGVTIALLAYLWTTRNRAALMLAQYGLLAGALGFFIGDFVQIVQRWHWGPFQYAALQEHRGWSKMEMLFGLVMGGGVAYGARRLAREGLAVPIEDAPRSVLNEFAVLYLFVPMMWWNFSRNITLWQDAELFPPKVLGMAGDWWALAAGMLLTALVVGTVWRYRTAGLAFVPRTALGKGQLLLLVLMWLIVGASFAGMMGQHDEPGVIQSEMFYLVCASAASWWLVADCRNSTPAMAPVRAASDEHWRPGRVYLALWGALPLLVLLAAWMSYAIAEGR
ncbi:MAG: hypothetical protein K1X71_08400 [Pirellulales bacterium]|nr:hypothetical protein [Pirellulales bacterium]